MKVLSVIGWIIFAIVIGIVGVVLLSIIFPDHLFQLVEYFKPMFEQGNSAVTATATALQNILI